MNITSLAPGKVLFAGEFAGMFNLPIVTCAVDLQTKTNIEETEEDVVLITTSFKETTTELSTTKLVNDWESAWKVFQDYERTIDFSLLKHFRDDINPLTLAIGAVLSESDTNKGFKLNIVTEIPIGYGLGSSASMCVSVLGAVSNYLNMGWSLEKINEMAHKVEKVLNGKPSGGDNTAVTYGGWQIFAGGIRVQALDINLQTNNWWLIDGGVPLESSLDIFQHVTTLLKKDEGRKNEIESRYKATVSKVIEKAREGHLFAESIQEEQAINELLGIVGDKGRKIVSTIEQAGGYARLCGAGGIKDGAGAVLAYSENRAIVNGVCSTLGLNYTSINLGGPGWYLEK